MDAQLAFGVTVKRWTVPSLLCMRGCVFIVEGSRSSIPLLTFNQDGQDLLYMCLKHVFQISNVLCNLYLYLSNGK